MGTLADIRNRMPAVRAYFGDFNLSAAYGFQLILFRLDRFVLSWVLLPDIDFWHLFLLTYKLLPFRMDYRDILS